MRFGVYSKYISSSKAWHLFIISILWISFYMIGNTAVSFWIVLWTDSVNDNNVYTYQSAEYFMGGYCLIYVFVAIFSYLRTYHIAMLGVKASENLHRTLLNRVMRAPTLFFDKVTSPYILLLRFTP